MKKKNRDEITCVKSFTQCIQWNLGDIPSLGLSNGDYLDELIYAIINKLCELSDPLDLSTLSLQCLIDKLDVTEPTPRNIQTVFQLLIDNDCTLKDLIDNLQDQINNINNTSLVLDLKCLAQTDGFGNPLPYNVQSVLQSLINELCILKDQVAYLNIVVVDLQTQINNINVTPYELPITTTCVSAGKKLDVAVKDIATSFCDLKNATGTSVQLQSAVGQQCSNLNTEFGDISGWILNPSNLAQSYSNLQLAFCDVLSRLIAIEQTCCAPSCDKIKIGFIYSFDYESRELTLSFTSGSGTVIPSGFEDCGSEFTFKSCDGDIILTSIQPISSNADLIFILPSGVCIDNLTVSIKTKFCLSDDNENIILTCRDCISKEIQIQSECCVLTNIDDEEIYLTYETTVIT